MKMRIPVVACCVVVMLAVLPVCSVWGAAVGFEDSTKVGLLDGVQNTDFKVFREQLKTRLGDIRDDE